MEPKYRIIGILAGILLVLAFGHLVFRVHHTKDAQHLTYNWVFLILIGQLLYGFYGYVNHLYGIIIPSICITTGVLYILYIKIVHERNESIIDELTNKEIFTK